MLHLSSIEINIIKQPNFHMLLLQVFAIQTGSIPSNFGVKILTFFTNVIYATFKQCLLNCFFIIIILEMTSQRVIPRDRLGPIFFHSSRAWSPLFSGRAYLFFLYRAEISLISSLHGPKFSVLVYTRHL